MTRLARIMRVIPAVGAGILLCGLVCLAQPLEAAAGLLRITSKPSGATLYINGSKRGRTPFSGTLNPGRYHIELRRGGFLTWTSYLELPQRSEMRLKAMLEKSTGTNRPKDNAAVVGIRKTKNVERGGLLIVNTKPSNVSVFMGKRLLGKTPLLKFVPVGRHAITLQLNGYEQVSKLVQIRTSKSVRLKVNMKAGAGTQFRMKQRKSSGSAQTDQTQNGSTSLMITSRPGARVYLNNRYLGRTPLISAGIKIGTYQLTLKRRGYLPYNRTIKLADGEQTRIKATLVRRRR